MGSRASSKSTRVRHGRRGRARLAAVAVLVGAWLSAPAAHAQAPVEPYAAGNYGSFRNILPPGENGLDNGAQLGEFEATGARPAHNNDQTGMYANLMKVVPNLTAAQIPDYYKDATFGVPAGQVQSSESPRADVTIVRDKGFGVPHIYGSTRAGLMFGTGYATGEDRLFFIDVLRHYGAGDLASFAGGANASMDAAQWQVAPYTQQDLDNQITYIRTHLSDGEQIYQDALNYVAGVNAYIDMAKLNPSLMPGEYAAIGAPQGPAPFQMTDLISIASLVGGIFGQGGGNDLQNALLEQGLAQRLGPEHLQVPGSPEDVAAAIPTSAPLPAVTRGKPSKSKRPKSKHRKSKRSKAKKRGRSRRSMSRVRVRHRALLHRRAHRPRVAVRHSGSGTAPGAASVGQSGFAAFLDFNRTDDPQAPTTVHTGASFPYESLPAHTAPGSLAMPDPGSVAMIGGVSSGAAPSAGTGTGAGSSGGAPGSGAPGSGVTGSGGVGGLPLSLSARSESPVRALLAFPRSQSNALLVSAARSATGHPIAVMGPQVGYFSPEILMEEDLHGPGIAAEGAAFPGVNLYVELGHGPDYAWSATSAGQSIIDTFAVPLCDPSGAAPTKGSSYYMYQGRCIPMQTLTRTESWTPNPADSTPPGSQTLQAQRTMLGLVVARATIAGRPVAYTRLRSTYLHELDSAVGFERFNEPAQMRNPAAFMNSAYQIGYTFNWFYADDQHVAYFNSGHNPIRAPGVNPLFPTSSSFPWQGFDGSANTSAQTPESAHPQVVDQDYLTSWNNKQAPGYADSNTAQQFSSIYRSQLLDAAIKAHLDRGQKMTLADLINAMGTAATQDLRGVQVLPYLLAVVGHPSDPRLAQAVSTLSAWVADGAHRVDPSGNGHYDHAAAVQIMDAWWPLLVQAEFTPTLGHSLLTQMQGEFPFNDEPGHGVSGDHLGSSFDVGFYGVVQEDLRAALGEHFPGQLSRVYCGQGSLDACRADLLGSLSQALGETPQQVYPADGSCAAGDQACSDSIRFRPLGAISQPLIGWQNRPTFQQALEIQGHGPRQ